MAPGVHTVDIPTPLALTFPSMYGYGLHTLEQQVLMDRVDICLLLREDQHLPQELASGAAGPASAGGSQGPTWLAGCQRCPPSLPNPHWVLERRFLGAGSWALLPQPRG